MCTYHNQSILFSIKDVLTYECSVPEDGQAVWKGNALTCTNEFILSLSLQDPKTCNNGDTTIEAVIINSTKNNTLTTELRIDTSLDLSGRTLVCSYDNFTAETEVKNFTILDYVDTSANSNTRNSLDRGMKLK